MITIALADYHHLIRQGVRCLLETQKDFEVVEGHSSADIARRLSISRRTAESHRANVMRKLRLGNQIDLIRFAIARGILTSPADP